MPSSADLVRIVAVVDVVGTVVATGVAVVAAVAVVIQTVDYSFASATSAGARWQKPVRSLATVTAAQVGEDSSPASSRTGIHAMASKGAGQYVIVATAAVAVAVVDLTARATVQFDAGHWPASAMFSVVVVATAVAVHH